MSPNELRGVWRAGIVGDTWVEGALGSPPPARESVYDLASLTKVIFASSMMVEEWLGSGVNWETFLSAPVRTEIPELNGTWLETISLGELWEHRSGLLPHKELFDPPRRVPLPNERREQLWNLILPKILEEPPAGARGENLYSDFDFILLALFLERRHLKSLQDLWSDWKQRHGIPAEFLTFGVSPENTTRFAQTQPTEMRHPCGEVNDNKAACLGGVSMHAGLFGSCEEVWAWLESLVRWKQEDPRVEQWLKPVSEFYRGEPGQRFHGGWDRPSDSDESQGGYPVPAYVVGHLGYTGTALWWQPESKRAAVLLTNRVYPEHTPENQAAVKKLRQRFFSDFWQGKLKPGWVPY